MSSDLHLPDLPTDLPLLPDGWRWTALSRLVDQDRGICYGIVQPGKHHSDGVPMVNTGDVLDGRVNLDIGFRVEKKLHDQFRRSTLRGGELLVTLVGANFGRVAIAPPEFAGYNCSRAVGVVPLTGNTEFVMFALRSPVARHFFDTWANTTAQPTFNLKDLGRLPVPIPPVESAKQISNMLMALDDRITLLRETNATLEAIAQALFKSWFVDFDPVRAKAEGRARQDGERSGQPRMPQASDLPRPGAEAGAEAQGQPEGAIQGSMSAAEGRMPKAAMDATTAALFPDSFEESELGLVPKGWQRLAFTETVNVIGGGTPKTSVPEYWDGDIPWFSVVDAPAVSDVFVIDTVKHISVAGLNGSSTKLLSEGTTIISARGTVGRLALVGKYMAMNQSCYGLQGKAGDAYFTYFSTYRLVENLKQRSHGSVFDTITTETMKGVQVIYPDANVIEAFEALLRPFMCRIKENLHQAQTLTQLRDTLLPRLISGQLRLPEAQEQLKDALV
jgi:type I restriction enzyme S subunit